MNRTKKELENISSQVITPIEHCHGLVVGMKTGEEFSLSEK